MKKWITMMLAVASLAACRQSADKTGSADNVAAATVKANPALAPVIKFEHDLHDFGKAKLGDKVTYTYNFTNVGKSPLIINDAVASCGCTKPEWPKEPIKPGDKGAIKVVFNTAGHPGQADKMITVTANTIPAQSMVHLVGEVANK